MIKVKPAPGLKIRDPQTHLFIDDAEGLEVNEKSLYWFRRLRDHDVVPFDEAAGASSAKSAPGTKGTSGKSATPGMQPASTGA